MVLEEITEEKDGTKRFLGVRIMLETGDLCCELRNKDGDPMQGNALVISATYCHLRSTGGTRADDYLAGIVAGFNHVALSGGSIKIVPG